MNIQPSAVHLPSQRTASGITARCIARCSALRFMPAASAVPDALPSTGQFALPAHSRERAAGRLARWWSGMGICLGRVLCCGATGSASAWTFPGQMLAAPGRLSASACHSASCFPSGRLWGRRFLAENPCRARLEGPFAKKRGAGKRLFPFFYVHLSLV